MTQGRIARGFLAGCARGRQWPVEVAHGFTGAGGFGGRNVIAVGLLRRFGGLPVFVHSTGPRPCLAQPVPAPCLGLGAARPVAGLGRSEGGGGSKACTGDRSLRLPEAPGGRLPARSAPPPGRGSGRWAPPALLGRSCPVSPIAPGRQATLAERDGPPRRCRTTLRPRPSLRSQGSPPGTRSGWRPAESLEPWILGANDTGGEVRYP